MVRIAAINYLNTVPFIYGLESRMDPAGIAMQFCTPSESARLLAEDKADIGIVPVGAIDSIPSPRIVSDFCIGSSWKVASVLLCSPCPAEDIDEIFLDVDSRTSVLLTKYLCREKWHVSPRFSSFDFSREALDEGNSYLLIGDKALLNSFRFKYVYDLAEEWTGLKNLPFVFACWIANKSLQPDFVDSFNQALEYGVNHIEEAVAKHNNQFPRDYACRYLQQNISFTLDSDKRAGLTEFWRVALEKLTPRACQL